MKICFPVLAGSSALRLASNLKASFREAVRWSAQCELEISDGQSMYDLPEPQLWTPDLHVAQRLLACSGCGGFGVSGEMLDEWKSNVFDEVRSSNGGETFRHAIHSIRAQGRQRALHDDMIR